MSHTDFLLSHTFPCQEMSFGDENGEEAIVLPSFATVATADAHSERIRDRDHAPDKLDHEEDIPPDTQNTPNIMATNTFHSKKLSAGSLSDLGSLSPEHSRIPRPSSTRPSRKPLELEECFRLAREKFGVNVGDVPPGSPSPAPRNYAKVSGPPFQYRNRMSPMPFTDKPIDLGRLGVQHTRREGTHSSKERMGSFSHKEEDSDEEFARKMQKFDEDLKKVKEMQGKTAFANRNDGRAARPASARKAAATSAEDGSVGNASFGTGSRNRPRQDWGKPEGSYKETLQRFMDDRAAAASLTDKLGIEIVSHDQRLKRKSDEQSKNMPPSRPATTAPRGGGYSWQVDDDFTAGDLQVSTSPPVGYARTNTKIDEIRELERMYPVQKKKRFIPQRTNTRLDEIRRLELEVEANFPIDKPEDSPPPPVHEPQSLNTDSEADRSRETEDSSKKDREPTTDLPIVNLRSSIRAHGGPKDRPQQRNNFEDLEGNKIPDTPVTVFPGASRNNLGDQKHQSGVENEGILGLKGKEPSPAKEDSQDLLRRLARASSKSPSPSPVQDKVDIDPEQEQKTDAVPLISVDKASSGPKDTGATGGSAAPLPLTDKATSSKPTIGFTSISRTSSNNSVTSKSSVRSWDPTARIQAEANLFALGNDSERGSFRVPSPVPNPEADVDDGDADETPRPGKFDFDPITMPTPVVTGAFIETPAPSKAEQADRSPSKFLSSKAAPKNRDTSSSPRASQSEGRRPLVRQASSRDTRRTKSASRNRSPLRNSVKPPTVADDLREILKKNELDDSTLDDITGLVMSASNPEKLVEMLKPKTEDAKEELPKDEQLKRLSDMGEALKTGLAGIRTARKGIERLEDQISSEKQPYATANGHAAPIKDATQAMSTLHSENFTYIQVPVPKLYRRNPKLRLTLFGFFVLLLSLWHMYWFVEGAFYDTWGKQKVCYRGSPCRYDMDDPEYGYVVPVKMDEWITGGAIRPHAARWLEEAQDSWADFEDWLTGTDIRTVNHQAIRDGVEKQQYWRRIDKKGFFPKWNPAPWMLPQFEAWERAAQAEEAAEARAALGYDDRDESANESESMDEDQQISKSSTVDPSGAWW